MYALGASELAWQLEKAGAPVNLVFAEGDPLSLLMRGASEWVQNLWTFLPLSAMAVIAAWLTVSQFDIRDPVRRRVLQVACVVLPVTLFALTTGWIFWDLPLARLAAIFAAVTVPTIVCVGGSLRTAFVLAGLAPLLPAFLTVSSDPSPLPRVALTLVGSSECVSDKEVLLHANGHWLLREAGETSYGYETVSDGEVTSARIVPGRRLAPGSFFDIRCARLPVSGGMPTQ
jgi:hypothetical protein